MTGRVRYAPRYQESWAVVVGVNCYENASPLEYAVRDAEKVAEALVRLGFPEGNVRLLVDGDASRASILAQLQSLSDKVGSDDRVLFFFAGHGLTRAGHRGDIGFLVPVDGRIENLQSLVRWDDLTRMADLIPAKHVLFVMDACYGGLAVTRSARGTHRFLKDILSRFARQVLAAGKADQVVADAGGPRPGHSVFTGHLLDALDGGAAIGKGVITANGVMAYVYDRVGRDTESAQTPHYGCLDGDGDFVFVAPPLADLEDADGHPQDVLIAGSLGSVGADAPSSEQELAAVLKDLLSDSSKRIRLDDLVMKEVGDLLRVTAADNLPVGITLDAEQFAERLQRYEDATRRVMCCMSLLGKWCTDANRSVLDAAVARMVDNTESRGGNTVLLGLRWYPALLALYCGGIGAISSGEYQNLRSIFTAPVRDQRTGEDSKPVIVATIDGMLDVHRAEAFKRLPGHQRHYVPLSEHLFTVLQPILEETLLLGMSYESRFDHFEVLLALTYVDLDAELGDECWGPPGRFVYKYRRYGRGPFAEVVSEAKQRGPQWAPLRAGFFAGSSDQFHAVAEQFTAFMGKLNWH